MLYLESFVHRVELAEIFLRWMVNQPRPEDVLKLKSIINFNSYISRLWMDRMARDLLQGLHGKEPRSFKARTKGDLKDFVVKHPQYTNSRIEALRSHYTRFPEDYFRETPFDGRIYYNLEQGEPLFVASTRFKRFRRIAEKGSRRIVEFLFKRIREHANDLASERAQRLGIPKEQLITSPEQMLEEFQHAERRLIKSIKKGTIQAELPVLAIPDGAGVKLIAEEDQYQRLLGLLEADPRFRVLEKESHTGNYNAINLRVGHIIPRELLLRHPPSGPHLEILVQRGFDRAQVGREYQKFLETAEDHVLMEIIVSDFGEFMESELGRAMHEERVLAQRSNREYRGMLASSVRYLMDYMFTLSIAAAQDPVVEVPIKLWVKYMPDTIDRAIRDLFNVPSDSSFDKDEMQSEDAAAEARTGQAPEPPGPAELAAP